LVEFLGDKSKDLDITWLKNVILKQSDRLDFLEKQNHQREQENLLLKTEVSHHRNEIDQINGVLLKANLISNSNPDINNNGIINQGRLKRPVRRWTAPTSCYHLSNLGHTLNGIYLIKKKDYAEMEAVFCNFQPPDGSHNR